MANIIAYGYKHARLEDALRFALDDHDIFNLWFLESETVINDYKMDKTFDIPVDAAVALIFKWLDTIDYPDITKYADVWYRKGFRLEGREFDGKIIIKPYWYEIHK